MTDSSPVLAYIRASSFRRGYAYAAEVTRSLQQASVRFSVEPLACANGVHACLLATRATESTWKRSAISASVLSESSRLAALSPFPPLFPSIRLCPQESARRGTRPAPRLARSRAVQGAVASSRCVARDCGRRPGPTAGAARCASASVGPRHAPRGSAARLGSEGGPVGADRDRGGVGASGGLR